MNKLSLGAASAVLAATMTVHTGTAEAGLLRRILLGGHHHHRLILIAPIVAAPAFPRPVMRQLAYPVAQPTQPQPTVVSNADGMGRKFDPAGMAWFDGKDQCWSGKQAWTFKNGSWYYGNYTWYPANGSWQTSAPDAPTPVDCQTIPAFAQAKPTNQGFARVETSPEHTSPSEYDVAGASECKRYFANVGQTMTVPCEK